MARTYNILIEQDPEGWFVSEVVELPGCHTQAKNVDELLVRTREAIKAYLADGVSEAAGKFIGVRQIEV